VWLFNYTVSIDNEEKGTRAHLVNLIVAIISGVSVLGSGIVLGLLRLKEPLFQFLCVQKLYQVMGEMYDSSQTNNGTEAERQLATDSLTTFLSSSLNVELVFVILKCVTERANQDLEEERTGLRDDPCPYMKIVQIS